MFLFPINIFMYPRRIEKAFVCNERNVYSEFLKFSVLRETMHLPVKYIVQRSFKHLHMFK